MTQLKDTDGAIKVDVRVGTVLVRLGRVYSESCQGGLGSTEAWTACCVALKPGPCTIDRLA